MRNTLQRGSVHRNVAKLRRVDEFFLIRERVNDNQMAIRIIRFKVLGELRDGAVRKT